jgi:hypothetical protein
MAPALADMVVAGATADVCDAPGWIEGWSAVLVVSGLWDEIWEGCCDKTLDDKTLGGCGTAAAFGETTGCTTAVL